MSDAKRGRPSLSPHEGDPTVKVNFYITKSLLGRVKARARDLGLKDAEVFRETLDKYLHLLRSEEGPDRVTLLLGETELGQTAARAALAWGTDTASIVRMAVTKGLSALITEGEALKKGSSK